MTPPVSNLRTLLALAWPLVISRSTQSIIGLADALMVAGLGEDALAAASTGAMNTFVALMIPFGVVFIVSSFSSQLTGRGDLKGARRFGVYGLGVAVVGQVLALLAIPAVGPLLGALGHEGEVHSLMTGYMTLRLLGGGPAIGLEALANYYGGVGNTRWPMLANVAAMVLNVGFNWVLIGGNLGAPAMGVDGAALASTLASTMAFLGLLGVFVWEGRGGRSPLVAREWWRVWRFGLPSGINWFLEFGAFMFFINVVVGGLGTTALAAMNAVFQVNSTSFMPAFALASAGSILVGQAIGASAKDEVPKIVRLTFFTCAAWQGAVSILYLVMPATLMAFFAHDARGDFLEVAARMLMLSAAWQLFDSAATTLAEALRAAGDTQFTLYARLAIAWFVFVPGTLLTVRPGASGDVIAMGWLVGYLALLALVLFLRFRSGAWRSLELVEPALEV